MTKFTVISDKAFNTILSSAVDSRTVYGEKMTALLKACIEHAYKTETLDKANLSLVTLKDKGFSDNALKKIKAYLLTFLRFGKAQNSDKHPLGRLNKAELEEICFTFYESETEIQEYLSTLPKYHDFKVPKKSPEISPILKALDTLIKKYSKEGVELGFGEDIILAKLCTLRLEGEQLLTNAVFGN